MTDEELIEANEIKEKIRKLNEFIFYGERTWTGQLIKRIPLITVKSNAYGALGSATYDLDTETKNEILELLRGKLLNLENQLKEM